MSKKNQPSHGGGKATHRKEGDNGTAASKPRQPQAAQKGSAAPAEAALPQEQAAEAAEVQALPVEEAAKAAEAAGTAETAGAAEEQPEQEASGTEETPPAGEAGPDAQDEQKRLAEMTRTVQVSVEQILARMEEEPAPAAEPEDADREPEEEPRQSLGARIGLGVLHGVWGIVKWLLLILLFVVMIAGAGIWWLYQGATQDMLPEIGISLEGQTLEPTAYDWRVPVVNDLVTRRYAWETEEETPALAGVLATVHPTLTVTPDGYDIAITIWDAEEQELFSGTAQDFTRFRFADSGHYRANITVSDEQEHFSGVARVLGRQTYEFTFEIGMRPTIYFDSQIVHQGDVVALLVSGISAEDLPTLETELDNVGFVPSSNGWVAYLPIPCDLEPGQYSVRVHTKNYVQDAQLTVRAQEWTQKDYSGNSQLVKPYLGAEDIPAELEPVFKIYDADIYWADSGFTEPFTRNATVRLAYGTTEYVGRSAADKRNGTGTGRTAINTVFSGRRGETLNAPAAGRVLFAQELEDTGYTLVIEHGGGVKSVFYLMKSLEVSVGDMVTQGQALGTVDGNYIAEVRVGAVPVDPLNIWRGQCNAMRCY